MDSTTAIALLNAPLKAISVAMASDTARHGAGLYSIFIASAEHLPEPYLALLLCGSPRLLYVGRSLRSLQSRLVEQDLQGVGHSTFFRGMGAILGFRPTPGSLRPMKNQNNYVFSRPDTAKIRKWMARHLSVRTIDLQPKEVPCLEKAVISELCPLLNTKHNPKPCRELATLRAECRRVALL